MILHNKIKELRQLKGLTQKQVADKINMLQSNYTKVEKGRLNLKIDKVHILAELFGVPAEELLHFENTTENTTTQTQENNNNDRLQELEKENENLKKEIENINEKFSYIKEINNFQASEMEGMKESLEIFILLEAKSQILDFLVLCENEEKLENYFYNMIQECNSIQENMPLIKRYKLWGYDKKFTSLFFENFKNTLEAILTVSMDNVINYREETIYELMPKYENLKDEEKSIKGFLEMYFHILYEGKFLDETAHIDLYDWLFSIFMKAVNRNSKKSWFKFLLKHKQKWENDNDKTN